MPTVRSPCTFEMAAHRADTRRRACRNFHASEKQVRDLLHVLTAVLVLGDPHAVAGDRRARLHINRGDTLDLLTRQSRHPQNVVPLGYDEYLPRSALEAVSLLFDECKIENGLLAGGDGCVVRFKHELHDPLRAATSPPTLTWQYSLAMRVAVSVVISIGLCGEAKRSNARSRSGFKTTIGTPRRDAFRSSVIIRGLLVPGFWPITKDRVRVFEVLQEDGALPDPDALRKSDARRLVTHIRAIGKIVGPELANEELSRGTQPRSRCVLTCRTRLDPDFRAN